MVQITNGITVPMIRPRGIPQLRQRRGIPVMKPLQLNDHALPTLQLSRPPARQLPLVHQPLYLTSSYQSPPDLQLTSVYQAPPAHQLQSVDPAALQSVDHQAPPGLQLQSVIQSVDHQVPTALQLQSVDPAALQSVDHQAPPALQLQSIDSAAHQSVDHQAPPALQLQSLIQSVVALALQRQSVSQSVDHQAPPAQQLQSVHPEAVQSVDHQAPPALQLQSVDPAALQSVDQQAPLAHQLQSVDPAAIQSVDQTDGNRNPGQSGGQTSSTSRNTDPDAPRSVTLRISAGTMFKALIGAIFTAAEAFMFYHLQQQGNSAPASSKIASTIVFVTLLLAFPFIATGVCTYIRSPFAAYILGNAGFLCITLSFFAMMHVWVPKLAWLVWTICGILLLGFAYFFAEDLKGFYAQRHRKMAAPIEV